MVMTPRVSNSIKGRTAVAGFTVIEIIIVLAVIGVLAVIAYPSYEGYQEKVIRTDTMLELQKMAGRIEAQKINYRRYDRIPLSAIFSSGVSSVSSQFPHSGTAYYTLTVTPNNDGVSPTLADKDWTLTATPISGERMADDGTMTLDSDGKKCRSYTASGSGTEEKVCGMGDEWRETP